MSELNVPGKAMFDDGDGRGVKSSCRTLSSRLVTRKLGAVRLVLYGHDQWVLPVLRELFPDETASSSGIIPGQLLDSSCCEKKLFLEK